ncbi:hypothetical protein ACIRQP_14740 [Streptomyces sp. NPDC102274]|uniref:hypothetical protein n=1 Tax=Streptomyces sp. NPDC102274 TaxID=3366151 RepID=UPI0037FF0457
MPADLNPSAKPPLSVRLRSDWLRGILRADLIRHDTLLGLVAHWSDDDAKHDVLLQLDALADAMSGPREGELDALVERVEDAAALDTAEIEIGLSDALRLRDELDAVIASLSRFNPQRVRPVVVPSQRERRTA